MQFPKNCKVQKPDKGERMRDDYVKVELKSFQKMCKDICDLKERCKELNEENSKLKTQIVELQLTQILTAEDEAFIKAEEGAEKMENEILGFLSTFMGDD